MKSACPACPAPVIPPAQETPAASLPLAKRRAPEPGDYDNAKQALWRLSRLPPEIQEAVIGHLPLADIAVWQQVSRDFAHRIRVSCLREKAFLRVLAHAFPRENHDSLVQKQGDWRDLFGRARPNAALSRSNYDRLVRPWLSGFSTNPLGPGWPGASFEPSVLFAAVTHTLQASAHLALEENASFRLPASFTKGSPGFSPDGQHLMVSTIYCSQNGGAPRRSATSIFSWDETGWHHGAPFTQTSQARCICFSPDGQRVAVAQEGEEKDDEKDFIKKVQIWEKGKTTDWHQTACLVPEHPVFHYCPHMVFSANGRSLVLQSSVYYTLHVWSLDARQQWLPSGFFWLCAEAKYDIEFSPDSCWLPVPVPGRRIRLCSQQSGSLWAPNPSFEHAAQNVGVVACFSSDSQRLALLHGDGTLSVWRLDDGIWSHQARILQRDAIHTVKFGPHGRQLVTQSAEWALLWEENAQGEWKESDVLNGGLSRWPFPHFDPLGRWLVVASGRLTPFSHTTTWRKDQAGVWTHCPLAQLSSRSEHMTPAGDGVHLAALIEHRQPVRITLALLEFQQGTWIVKAEAERAAAACPASDYTALAIDPLCCHLAVTFRHSTGVLDRSQETGVAFLRVQPGEEALQ